MGNDMAKDIKENYKKLEEYSKSIAFCDGLIILKDGEIQDLEFARDRIAKQKCDVDLMKFFIKIAKCKKEEFWCGKKANESDGSVEDICKECEKYGEELDGLLFSIQLKINELLDERDSIYKEKRDALKIFNN